MVHVNFKRVSCNPIKNYQVVKIFNKLVYPNNKPSTIASNIQLISINDGLLIDMDWMGWDNKCKKIDETDSK